MTNQNEKNQTTELSFETFDPSMIPFQDAVMDDAWNEFNYSHGAHEVLLSGSVGSAKSVLAAHMIVRHCLENRNACVLITRRSLIDLKETLFLKILEQIVNCRVVALAKMINRTSAKISFINGSRIIARTYADRAYTKVRSLDLSMAVFEEAIELDIDAKEFYTECLLRLGRIPSIKQNLALLLTNPDDPSHWIYDHFELEKDELTREAATDRDVLKHVYYSLTDENPFLTDAYKKKLKTNFDPKTYERMALGRWIYISGDKIYHMYDRENNYRDYEYEINPLLPIRISWDFNIGEGKPMSLVIAQCDKEKDEVHVFGEVIIGGMRTEDSCEELAGSGILDHNCEYVVHGDAAGKHNDTRNKQSDYDIIKKYFANYKNKSGKHLNYRTNVHLSNGPIRDRHNNVNAYLENTEGKHRLFVYKGADTIDKGLRLTKLKPGGNYIEDDGPSCPYQHCTTALGYMLNTWIVERNRKPQGTLRL